MISIAEDRTRRPPRLPTRAAAGPVGDAGAVRFGIFFELSVPPPFDGAAERAVYRNALEQAVLADELGFDWVWAVEHHFLEGYSHCSAPELFLTAVAARTERIRVGHGAVVCVPEMNHPVRVAERAAALDILSGGRLDVGTARSSTWTELGGFDVDPDMTKQTWDEYVHVLPKMWSGEPFSHEGLGWRMPERRVLPTPVQSPHPPLWVTVTTPGTELDAADRGIGCLGVAAVSFVEQERRTAEYRRRIQLCEPVGGVNDAVTTQNFLYCHEDIDVAARGRREHGDDVRPVQQPPAVDPRGLPDERLPQPRQPAAVGGQAGDRCAERSPTAARGRGHRRPGADHRRDRAVGERRHRRHQLHAQRAWRRSPRPTVLDSLRLFAAEVMPKFRS